MAIHPFGGAARWGASDAEMAAFTQDLASAQTLLTGR